MADEIDLKVVDEIVAAVGREPECALPILQKLQERFHYLPEPALRRVCATTAVTPAAIAGIATFYAQFRDRPAGRHFIRVCIGTACHVKGAELTFEAFKRYLGIAHTEDTDKDRLFTVEKVACLGCCMLAPAVRIDDVTYGFVDASKIPHVLRDFLEAEEDAAQLAPRHLPHLSRGEASLCLCSSCTAGGAHAVHRELCRQIEALHLHIAVRNVGCTGISYQTPLVQIRTAHGHVFRYGLVKPADVRRILLRHFKPVTLARRTAAAVTQLLEKVLSDETWEPVTRYAVDLRQGPDAQHVGPQRHLATEHSGELDPLDLDEYLAHDGFQALQRCLRELSPEAVIAIVEASALRGRGGGGYPTGTKWRQVRNAPDTLRYVVCNGDEGDPGAFMDRMLLESFPLRVIEGMLIAAYAVGAATGYLYIRAEYPLATERVRKALRICAEHGWLGENPPGSGRTFQLKVVEGAGAFVCGEETALIAAIEGRRGTPRFRPPFPSEEGLWGKPTLINNVETFALVPWILRHGAAAFAAMGTATSKGTKSFALAGKVARGGLIEVPMGITLRQIVDDIGGGIYHGHKLKAVQVGGPSGGCVPERLADTPVDYEQLLSTGTMMGSGGMVVLDESDCMVDIARYFMTFTQRESCGKCTHCRIGTKRMLEILERLCAGKGEEGDLERLEQLGETIQAGSLCGLGRTAPNPVLSTLRYFRDEYEAHLRGRCPAGKCAALIHYTISDDCIGCTRCAQYCPVDAIPMTPHQKHAIDDAKCTRCDTCREVCPANAVKVQ